MPPLERIGAPGRLRHLISPVEAKNGVAEHHGRDRSAGQAAELLMTKFVDSHRFGVNSGSSMIGVVCVQHLSIWSIALRERWRDFFKGGVPDSWTGSRKAHFIGIGPVYTE